MNAVWELDFYSRPILDENQKKLWELLVCDPERSFEYTKFCTGAEANARWLEAALEEALPLWREATNRPGDAMPERVRFFRRSMSSIITRACEEWGVPSQPSRRTFTLFQWLRERNESFYPNQPGYQPLATPPAQIEPTLPQSLPDALVGQGWTFASLEAAAFEEADQWEMAFGEVFSLKRFGLALETQIPGLIIFSSRAKPLAGWISGLELAALDVEQGSLARLILETGVSDRWVLANLRTPQMLTEAKNFQAAKQQAQQVHFLAVQSSPQDEAFAGFWVLQAADLP